MEKICDELYDLIRDVDDNKDSTELGKLRSFIKSVEDPPEDIYDATKLMDGGATYTDLLPPPIDQGNEAAHVMDFNETGFVQTPTETVNPVGLNGQMVSVPPQTGTLKLIDANGQTFLVQLPAEPVNETAKSIPWNSRTVIVQSPTDTVNQIDSNGQTVFVQSPTETVNLMSLNGQIVIQDNLPTYTVKMDGQINSTASEDIVGNPRLDAQGSPQIANFVEEEDFEQMPVVAPAEVFGDAPKKRGRKRKSDTSTPSRRQRPKKQKVYEIETPFENEELEKKRKNAVNAKRHRDLQKQLKVTLEEQIAILTSERDALKQKVKEIQQRELALIQKLQVYQQQQEQHVVYRLVS